MAEEEVKTDATAAEAMTGQFAPQKIYVKDLSFETPHSPSIFKAEWNPLVNMNLNSEANPMDDKLYEVVLTITVTVKMGEKTAYLVEARQAGIFHIDGFPEDIITRMVAIVCPNILFPFARELVSDLVTRGGFPQLLLAPVNFDALYEQQQQNSAPSADAETKH
ncbi:MAG: preprotein translocase subunit SecB [Gammaproteobacteria bacterium]|jgi:preprotein translocase subunit SecB